MVSGWMAPASALGALCLAACPQQLWASSLEDGFGLVQKTVNQMAVDLSSETKQLPDPGNNGFTFTRTTANVAPGNVMQVGLMPFCKKAAGDEHGPETCVAYFNTLVYPSVKLLIAGGLKSGDVVKTETAYDLSMNSSSSVTQWLPQKVTFGKECTVCTGSCVETLTTSNIEVTSTRPTSYDEEPDCSGTTEDFVIENSSFTFLPQPKDLNQTGTVDWSFSVKNSAATTTKAEGAYRLAFTQTSPMTELYQTMPAELGLQNLDEQSYTGNPLFPTGLNLLDLPQKVLASMHQELPDLLRENPDSAAMLMQERSAQESKPITVDHTLIFKMTVSPFTNGATGSVVFGFDSGCTSVDPYGSVDCEVPAQQAVNFNADITMETTVVETDTLYVETQAVPGGLEFMRKVAGKDLLPMRNISVPLCGDSQPKQEWPFIVPLIKKGTKCGLHKFTAKTTAPVPVNLPGFENFEVLKRAPLGMPYIPLDFNGWLPMTAKVNLEWRHADGSVFAKLMLEFGIGRV